MGRIETIKLKNFKSFRKAKIPISSGYTTIVGPNGSGKSNVIDSIAFVLGSTSTKSLRAGRLTDLVNMAAKDNMAEVTIELKDKGDRHSISRKIDKKGNSVFRLNGRRTTKFHIDEFLGKMNISPDGHNIIMQGDVTRFIKMTPLQRRQIIDEICGIAEYEEKKKEALRELGKVEEKIKEATIISGTKSGYLKELSKEKIEAERYEDLKTRINNYKATITKRDLDLIEKNYKEAMDFIAKKKDELDKVLQKKVKLEADLVELEKKYDELNEKIFEESDKKQAGVRKEIEGVRNKIAVVEEKMRASKELIDKNRSKQEEVKQKISEIGLQIKDKESAIDDLITEEEGAKRKVLRKQKQLDELLMKTDQGAQLAFKELEKLSSEVNDKKEKLYALNSEIETITERVNLRRATIDSQKKESKDFKQRKKDYEQRIADTTQKNKTFTDSFKKINEKLSSLLEKEKNLEQSYQDAEEELSTKRESFTSLESRIATLKDVKGKTKAVEAILKNKNLDGVLGTIGDLCKYKPEHALAIENAAGPKLFYILTKTAHDATDAIRYLKENKLGIASFIPLDRIKVKEYSPESKEVMQHKKAVGLALNLLEFDEQHRKAFEFAFSDTVVMQDISAIKEVGIGKARMVSLEGDLAEYSGLITGGFSKRGALIADVKQLDSLKEGLKGSGKHKQTLVKQLENLRDNINLERGKKTEAEIALKESEITLREWKDRLIEYEQKLKSQISPDEKQIKEMEEQVTTKRAERKDLEKQLSKMIEKRTEFRKNVDTPEAKEFNELLQETQTEHETLKEELSTLRVNRNTLRSEIEKVLLNNRKQFEQDISVLDKENRDIDKQVKKLSDERDEFSRTQKEKEQKARELASSMTELFTEKNNVDEQRRKKAESMGENNRKIDIVKEDINDKQIDMAKTESRYNSLKSDWGRLKRYELIQQGITKLREELPKLEEQFSQIGSVNMKAIEMYRELKKDITDIEEKSKKLDAEKKAVVALMEEIETKKINAFMETFNALNTYFDQYFKEFYPESGSRATIKLEDPEKALDSGLLIEASPAGKRIKTIESMSGGEKSITALAFIFAIQAYNPSPFYILDEVDAALDKANSERVAKMLKKFAKQLQFIIITHNAPVTRESDQIIGVHMDKDGSSIIEVDLKQYAK